MFCAKIINEIASQIFHNNSHVTNIETFAGPFPLFLRNLFPSQVEGKAKSIAHVLLPPFGGLEEEEEDCEPLVVSLCLTACVSGAIYGFPRNTNLV
jgi:hypothetical protein